MARQGFHFFPIGQLHPSSPLVHIGHQKYWLLGSIVDMRLLPSSSLFEKFLTSVHEYFSHENKMIVFKRKSHIWHWITTAQLSQLMALVGFWILRDLVRLLAFVRLRACFGFEGKGFSGRPFLSHRAFATIKSSGTHWTSKILTSREYCWHAASSVIFVVWRAYYIRSWTLFTCKRNGPFRGKGGNKFYIWKH